MRRHRFALLATALAAAVLVPAAAPSAATAARRASTPPGIAFTSTPTSGATGTVIDVAGRRCLLPGGIEPGEGVVVRLRSQGQVLAFTTLPVARNGTWSGRLPVPAGTPARLHQLDARCVYPEVPDPVVYGARTFTVTGEGAGAESTPATPTFNGGIEPYGEYDGQSTCSPSIKPGMAAFMRIVLRNYGGGSLGVSRACGAGGQSEHKEGRAWDWAMNAGSARDRSRVQALMNWLFATDTRCNHYARARRLGVMYIIWNRHMFRLYDVDRGWAPYSGSSPHTDHVHFSLTRDGGAGSVSFYHPTFQAPAGWTPGRHRVRDVTVGPALDGLQPLTGDFDGDERDDLLWYDAAAGNGQVWYTRADGRFVARGLTMGPGRAPVVGDFNGDCRDDVFWYGPGAVPDRQWQGLANRTFRSVAETVGGTYQQPVAGDFNGDRVADILWYNPGPGEDRLWRGSPYGFVARSINVGGNYRPFTGDFDGDLRDDVFWYGPGSAPDLLWYGRATGFTPHDVTVAGDTTPLAGDFNGDDRTDIFWYGVGEAPDRMWTGRPNRSFTGHAVDAARPYERPAVGDFDGDLQDDVFWHASPLHEDRIWRF
ncbi:MAG: VCBS repeat-containing protein [Acidimicrobiales bacterium]